MVIKYSNDDIHVFEHLSKLGMQGVAEQYFSAHQRRSWVKCPYCESEYLLEKEEDLDCEVCGNHDAADEADYKEEYRERFK